MERLTRHAFPLWHYAAATLARTFRVVPYGFRYRAARTLARAIEPLLRWTGVDRARWTRRLESSDDIALESVLSALTRHGVDFGPDLTLEGKELVEEALRSGRGALAISAHTMLSAFVLRGLHDAGLDILPVVTQEMVVPGTRTPQRVLRKTPSWLFTVRDSLRRGALVSAMIDRADAEDRGTERYDFAGGEILLATSLIDIALRANSTILFLAGKSRDGRIEVILERCPSDIAAGGTEAVAGAFVAFLERVVELPRA